ncbi:MAG TPA: Asp23/Gls24 family envelope stress response protein [Candidatus Ornithomonoglobus intestinigallinarum]|uniref:Asp23/Gls24 family envelope stress response protein n=1 Tax=Candidatus Ornithomonoglobus intestinigallinarum TaxID=2840894 RepID=A0A9D1H3N3_9FIRM|nr:Asp23/Gls24 family envelope stress response protein [Candidatus Ornithomonoglobus intestinigallinarum]
MEENIKNTETSEEEVEVKSAAPEEEQEIGNIKISVDVVSTIAGIAASQTKGVAGMYSSFAGGIAEKLGAKKSPSKGVKVDMAEKSVKIDLYIVVEYGVRIPELAWELQEDVKNNVETMTGLEVEKVNIHIEGVSFASEETEEIAAEATAEEALPEGE